MLQYWVGFFLCKMTINIEKLRLGIGSINDNVEKLDDIFEILDDEFKFDFDLCLLNQILMAW